jgi:MYXO-CTERM domain-containing protein
MKHHRLALGLLLALAAACQGLDAEVGQETRASLGGTPDTDFPNVCVMHVQPPPDDQDNPQPEFACTCTLVEAQTVLTSARCVNENLEKDMVEGITIKFGTGFAGGTAFAIDGGAAGITLHRYFDPDGANLNELALIRLVEAPTAEPVTLNDDPADLENGPDLTLVGFGDTEDADDIDTVRNSITTPITTVGDDFVKAGTDELTTCPGDSGAPGFLNAAVAPVMAVMTVRQDDCNSTVQRTRLDLYTESFLYPFIDLYSGPCPLDGNCTTDLCRTPDRDCPENKCLWENDPADCEEDCPTRDWDCALGSDTGAACTKDGDCEHGGRCVVASDDETFKYCNRPCGTGLEACPTGMECMDDECVYLAPSPGSHGATCTGPDACRSGVCECGVCQVQAGDGVCTQGGGGFCAVGGGDAPGLAALALLALGLPIAIRRRRRTKMRS